MPLFDRHTGLVKLRPKQGEKEKQKKDIEAKNKIKEICLHCERSNCRGCTSRNSMFTIKAVTESTHNSQNELRSEEEVNIDILLPIEESESESENTSNGA